ncbi:ankyrin repeat domain-containing protein [Photobacterium halotolerans]|uniref:ankyrin repeat domain-containing protein n=1 Tax=Photobacterium halotolerans TaxID=265726 RepID=UPI001372AA5D|nr:ankyrin repeat domain-containing protein [Photobacterium halotolerans]NAX45442.1 ankyrin repeat domain-containing protein [Photobacterium halotolerans]
MSYIDKPEFKFFQAIKRGNLDQAEALLGQGVDVYHVTEKEKWTYLHKALTNPSTDRQGPVESINYLIEKGLDVNAIDDYGYTPLIYAVRQRNVPAMRALLENGADKTIEQRGKDSVSALRMAVKGKPYQYDVVKVLLEYGADPDASTPEGKSVRELMDILAGVDPVIKELIASY